MQMNPEPNLKEIKWCALDSGGTADVQLNKDGRYDPTSAAKNPPSQLQMIMSEK